MKKFNVTIKSKTEQFEPYTRGFYAESYEDATERVHEMCAENNAIYSDLIQLFYKWVRSGTLSSIFATGPLEVKYKIGEFVSAPVGKLFLFEDIESACAWGSQEFVEYPMLYECEALGVYIPTEFQTRLSTWRLDIQKAQEYWAGKYNAPCSFHNGVVLAEQVKLVREVK